ncbi:MAG: hypothetical protein JO000_21540 [Alphaproteobacteria bacterium]|nr:hypothetical protein [Alphaproteobacteria bacterium]
MTKQWRPHVDLARLSAALSEDIIAAPEPELRAMLADPVFPGGAIVREVRDVIAHAIGESDESSAGVIGPAGPSRLFVAL